MSGDWQFGAIPEDSAAGKIIQRLEDTGRPPLAPKKARDVSLTSELNGMTGMDVFAGYDVRVMNCAEAFRSGLLLWNDCLEDSHVISQQIHTTTGSYWHGIMHRREPDYGNSKYWFRKVGSHEVFPQVLAAAKTIVQGSGAASAEALVAGGAWDAFAMVDACEDAASAGDAKLTGTLEEIQLAEIRILLDYCWTQALG